MTQDAAMAGQGAALQGGERDMAGNRKTRRASAKAGDTKAGDNKAGAGASGKGNGNGGAAVGADRVAATGTGTAAARGGTGASDGGVVDGDADALLGSRPSGPAADGAPAGERGTPDQRLHASPDRLAVLGSAVILMSQMPSHKHLFLTDLEWALLPPIALGQFRMWRKGPSPMAFATWAFLSEDAEKRIVEGGVLKMRPVDWKSGDIPWLIDIICPFGGMDQAVRDLRESVFKGRKLKTLQPAPGGGMAVVEW